MPVSSYAENIELEIMQPKIVNSFGNPVDEIFAPVDNVPFSYQPSALLKNTGTSPVDFTFYVIVDDSNELINLNSFSASINPDQDFTLALTWNPQKEGKHTLIFGVWNNLGDKKDLITPVELDVNVISQDSSSDKSTVELEKEKVPTWIKNNAKWWSEGNIDDNTFVDGIQFLMKEKIVSIPDLPDQASEKARPNFVDKTKDPQYYIDRYNKEESYKKWFDENYPDYTIEEAVGITKPIPGWIKNNADWWAEGLISEDEFVKGIEFLVENKILIVN